MLISETTLFLLFATRRAYLQRVGRENYGELRPIRRGRGSRIPAGGSKEAALGIPSTDIPTWSGLASTTVANHGIISEGGLNGQRRVIISKAILE